MEQKEQVKPYKHRLATYAAFALTVFVGASCLVCLAILTNIWQQPYTDECSGLCGNIWQFRYPGGGALWRVYFWQPVAMLYIAICIFFCLSYIVFYLEYAAAQAMTDVAYRRRLWWWRGLTIWIKLCLLGYAAFGVWMFTLGWLLPWYITGFWMLVWVMQPAFLPTIGIGCFVGMYLFNNRFENLEKLPASFWPQIIFGFIVISGMAALAFSILTFPH